MATTHCTYVQYVLYMQTGYCQFLEVRMYVLYSTYAASGRNVGKVFNPVVKLVLENLPFSCLSQLKTLTSIEC